MTDRPRGRLAPVLVTLASLAAALVVFSFFGGNELAVGNLVLRVQSGATSPLDPPSEAAVAGSTALPPDLRWPGESPRNVVVVVGDGMGVGHVSAAGVVLHGPGGGLAMTSTPFVGLMSTWATDNLAPDSAAAGTALATGRKVRKKAVGVLDDGRAARNLFEAARASGRATGIVTTSGLVDATPAVFTSHVAHREAYDEIFEQMLSSGTDVLIGGDWTGYSKVKRNTRYLELLGRAEELAAEHGYSAIFDADLLATTPSPLLALFSRRSDSKLQHGPPLSVTARRALDLLGDAPEGFLLVVESEVVDEAAHHNDVAATMDGMRELDEAVAMILDATRQRGDTLVVVLADHDTGGLGLVEGKYGDGEALVRWNYHLHLANLVPIFAFGPGAEAFTGVYDNTAFATRMALVMGLETLPELTDSAIN